MFSTFSWAYVCLRHDLRIGVCNLLQFTWLWDSLLALLIVNLLHNAVLFYMLGVLLLLPGDRRQDPVVILPKEMRESSTTVWTLKMKWVSSVCVAVLCTCECKYMCATVYLFTYMCVIMLCTGVYMYISMHMLFFFFLLAWVFVSTCLSVWSHLLIWSLCVCRYACLSNLFEGEPTCSAIHASGSFYFLSRDSRGIAWSHLLPHLFTRTTVRPDRSRDV